MLHVVKQLVIPIVTLPVLGAAVVGTTAAPLVLWLPYGAAMVATATARGTGQAMIAGLQRVLLEEKTGALDAAMTRVCKVLPPNVKASLQADASSGLLAAAVSVLSESSVAGAADPLRTVKDLVYQRVEDASRHDLEDALEQLIHAEMPSDSQLGPELAAVMGRVTLCDIARSLGQVVIRITLQRAESQVTRWTTSVAMGTSAVFMLAAALVSSPDEPPHHVRWQAALAHAGEA